MADHFHKGFRILSDASAKLGLIDFSDLYESQALDMQAKVS
jgi:hypothetical protein